MKRVLITCDRCKRDSDPAKFDILPPSGGAGFALQVVPHSEHEHFCSTCIRQLFADFIEHPQTRVFIEAYKDGKSPMAGYAERPPSKEGCWQEDQ